MLTDRKDREFCTMMAFNRTDAHRWDREDFMLLLTEQKADTDAQR
jgi:hypothetical protein